MKIKAAVLRATDGEYAIEELSLAEPGPGQVLVRMVGAGHCHTDLAPRAGVGFGEPPIVGGHEGSGVVESVGAAVTSVSAGDHVVLSFDSCGGCASCHDAQPAYCDTFFERNLTGFSVDGGTTLTDGDGNPVAGRWFGQSSFATHAVVDEANVLAVDPALPLELLGPLGCGVQTGAGAVLEALRVRPGESIVIAGTGAVGLSAVMAARVSGASTIIAVDLNEERLQLAREFGATHTIVGGTGVLAEQVREIAPGGADYGLDTTGLPAVIADLLGGLTVRGTLGVLGVQQGDVVIPPLLVGAGRTIVGIIEGSAKPQTFIPRLISLWQAGLFPFDRMITRFRFDEINEAERKALAGEVVKPVLVF